MESQYFVLHHAQRDNKTEIVLVKSFHAKDDEQAKQFFEKHLEETNTLKQQFLTRVLGMGGFVIEKQFVFKDGPVT